MEVWIAGGVGLGLSVVVTVVCRRVGLRLGIVAHPRDDRWHKRPVPLLGGVAIAASVSGGMLALPEWRFDLLVVWAGALAVFAMGLLDDVRPLRPQAKLIGQVVAAAVVVGFGLELQLTPYPAINTLVTLLWIVGLTNAFNLLDNMDGLAAGTAAIASGFRLLFCLSEGDPTGAAFAAALLGGLLGFLAFNTSPASIFMGDAGSMLIGFAVASLSLVSEAAHTRDLVSILILPVLVLMVPIFDTVLVTLNRILANRRVSVGGRDHTSHRLVELGLSEREAVGMLYVAALLCGAVAYFSRFYGFSYGVVLISILMVGTVLVGVLLSQVKVQYSTEPLSEQRFLHRALVGIPFKRQLATAAADVTSIIVAYYSAYLLRFEGSWAVHSEQFARTLPIVLCCQLLALVAYRVYRGSWRYAAVADLVRLAKAATAGTVVSVVALVLLFRFEGQSRAVHVLDWLVLIAMLGGSRMLFRVLTDQVRRGASIRDSVLVYGAGDLGELAIRELLGNRGLSRKPVGLVDDDPAKKGIEIHGYPVLGSGRELRKILRARPVNEVVIAAKALSSDQIERIESVCREKRVRVSKLSLELR